jgi:hypothetical protein
MSEIPPRIAMIAADVIKLNTPDKAPEQANCAVGDGSASVAWEVEINYMSCVVFAATKAKAKWLAVKSYWDAYGRSKAWPNASVARQPLYDRFPHREPKAYSPEYVRSLC